MYVCIRHLDMGAVNTYLRQSVQHSEIPNPGQMDKASLAEMYLQKLDAEQCIEGDQRVAATVLRSALEGLRSELQAARAAMHVLAYGLNQEALG